MVAQSIQGKYLGMKKVREGRQGEISMKERKELQKAVPNIDLELRSDGTFKRQVTDGAWRLQGDRVILEPSTFGGETLEGMRRRAEDSGRMFNLAFVFAPFELRVEGDRLVTPDDEAVVYTEFRRHG